MSEAQPVADAGAAAPPTLEERVAGQLEAIVNKRLENNQLVLPALPAVAVKCLALIKEAEFSLRDAAALIEKDPILAAQLVRLASSAAMGAREPMKSVFASVSRIGVQKLRTFLIEASSRKVFESRDARIAEALKGLWDHSRVVALMARDVVAFSNSGDPEMGYLAGLLHDIGKPVVAALLLETERSLQDTRKNAVWLSGAQFLGVLQRCHQKVGLAMASRWEMPDPVQRAIRDCTEYDNADRLSIANCVRFANAVAKHNGVYVGPMDKDDVEALVMIGKSLLNIDEEVITRLGRSVAGMLKENP